MREFTGLRAALRIARRAQQPDPARLEDDDAEGSPILYQGTELWDLSYVDPDNRRPVDYAARRRALDAVGGNPGIGTRWRATGQADRSRLVLTQVLLQLRNRFPDILQRGGYRPIEVGGTGWKTSSSPMRGGAEKTPIIVAMGRIRPRHRQRTSWPRRPHGMRSFGWPSYAPRNVFTGREIAWTGDSLPVSHLFRTLPIAILQRAHGLNDRPGPWSLLIGGNCPTIDQEKSRCWRASAASVQALNSGRRVARPEVTARLSR